MKHEIGAVGPSEGRVATTSHALYMRQWRKAQKLKRLAAVVERFTRKDDSPRETISKVTAP